MGKKKKKKKRRSSKAAGAGKTAAQKKQSAEKTPEPPVEKSPPAPVKAALPDEAAKTGSDKPTVPAEKPGKTEERQKEEPVPSVIEKKINRDIKVRSRIRRMLPDLIRVALAFTVIGVGAAIWWKPPLLTASYPVTTFKYKNQPTREAILYRPLAMPERYYVQLPEKLESRYEWFAIDRRREVVALTKEPKHSFLSKTAIKRGDDLGLDLEFRDIDGYEWLIYFYQDAIVFSNNLLVVRLDTKKPE